VSCVGKPELITTDRVCVGDRMLYKWTYVVYGPGGNCGRKTKNAQEKKTNAQTTGLQANKRAKCHGNPPHGKTQPSTKITTAEKQTRETNIKTRRLQTSQRPNAIVTSPMGNHWGQITTEKNKNPRPRKNSRHTTAEDARYCAAQNSRRTKSSTTETSRKHNHLGQKLFNCRYQDISIIAVACAGTLMIGHVCWQKLGTSNANWEQIKIKSRGTQTYKTAMGTHSTSSHGGKLSLAQ